MLSLTYPLIKCYTFKVLADHIQLKGSGMNYLVNIYKMLIALITSLVFLLFTILFFSLRLYIPGAVCIAFFAVYICLAAMNATVIRIDEIGVRKVFPRSGNYLLWTNINEVGVVGTKVIGSSEKKHTGSKYIYFSENVHSEDELFDLCLRWPPVNVPYIRFTHKRIARIQSLWSREITMFNTGSLHI